MALLSTSGLPLSACGNAEPPEVVSGHFEAEVSGDTEGIVRRLGDFGFSGVVLVDRPDGRRTVTATGFADYVRSIVMTETALFPIASLSKQITATAILRLQEQGRLRVREPVRAYLPSLDGSIGARTLHELLTHTSGLGDHYSADPLDSIESLVETANGVGLVGTPGKFRYSNLGYNLLAAVVERASGVKYERFVTEQVLKPAGTTSIVPVWDAAMRLDFAVGHPGFYDQRPLRNEYVESWGSRGASGWAATVDDLARWLQALDTGRVLRPATLDSLFHDYGEGYAYGWEVSIHPEHGRVVEHGGASFGNTIHLRWYRDLGLLIIAASNQRVDVVPPALVGVVYVSSAELGEPLPALPTPIPGPDRHRDLVGRWRSDAGEFVFLSRGGTLLVGGVGQEAIDFLAHGDPLPDSTLAHAEAQGHRLLQSLARGESGLDVADFDPQLPPDVWEREMPREWSREAGGPATDLKALGTARIRGSGNLRSYFRLTGPDGSSKVVAVVSDGEFVLGIEGGEPVPVATVLVPRGDGEWVGWRATIRRTVTVRLRGTPADRLVLTDGVRTLRATRAR